MKNITVLYGIGIAIAFSLLAPVVVGLFSFALAPMSAFRSAVSLGIVVYAVLLAHRSTRKSGKVSSLAVLTIGAALLLIIAPRFGTFAFASAALVWLARVLLASTGGLHACAELLLVGAALSAASVAAATYSGMAMPVWVFFLVLAAGPFVAGFFRTARKGSIYERTEGTKFEQAYRNAENALSILSAR